jgi:DNA topoisomerase-3
MALYQALANVAPNTVDVCRTAQWENLWDRVLQGSETAESAVERIVKATTVEVELIKGWKGRQTLLLGKPKVPSDAMKIAVKTIAKAKGLQVSEDVLTSFDACSAFIDEHGEKRDPTLPPGAPSEAAVAFARKLAAEAGVEILEATLGDRKALKAWIDKTKASVPSGPPTEKALAFAEKLAAEKGVEVPEKARGDGQACSAFIKKMQGGGKKGRGGAGGKGKGKGEAKIIKPTADA